MNLEDFKTNYANAEQEQVSKEVLIGMLNVNKHPVLRGIRIQLMIESIVWTLFLAFSYDFFDGHLKPMLWNILLVSAVGLLLVHNMLSYQIMDNQTDGLNVIDSLKNHLKRMHKYAYLSIFTRAFAILIVFGYFLSAIDSFESRHYWSLGFLVLIISAQVYSLWWVWMKRINTLALRYKQLVQDIE